MSDANNMSAAANGEVAIPARTSITAAVCDCIRDAINALPSPFSQSLSKHCLKHAHEDVPGDSNESPILAGSEKRTSIPPADPKLPHRLSMTLPPRNFGAVVNNSIFRSGYPEEENFEFLKCMGLKTILTLVPEEIPASYKQFMAEHDIQHFQVTLPANKEGVKIEKAAMDRVLQIVMDRTNHPMLVHCNKGKHRTGCTVGSFMKVQGFSSKDIYSEYHTYAGAKARAWDEVFMESYDVDHTILLTARLHNWVAKSKDKSNTGVLTPPSSSAVSTKGGSLDAEVPSSLQL